MGLCRVSGYHPSFTGRGCASSQYREAQRLDIYEVLCRVSMPMSGINTPTGVTPSVSGEDGSAFTASKDRADGDVQSAHTPRQPFSFTALPSHLSTGGDSAVAHDVAHEAIPKDEQLKSESAAYFRGCVLAIAYICLLLCIKGLSGQENDISVTHHCGIVSTLCTPMTHAGNLCQGHKSFGGSTLTETSFITFVTRLVACILQVPLPSLLSSVMLRSQDPHAAPFFEVS